MTVPEDIDCLYVQPAPVLNHSHCEAFFPLMLEPVTVASCPSSVPLGEATGSVCYNNALASVKLRLRSTFAFPSPA